MKRLKKVWLAIDTFVESFALISLLAIIILVTIQVFTRKLLNYVFPWGEETILILLAYFSFLGIAIGFREKLHLGIDSFTEKLPKPVNQVLDKIIYLSIFAFGGYLVYYGWSFTKLMNESRLSATDLPSSIVYVIMPITGVLTCVYSALQLFGADTSRHHGMGGEHE
ncbi:TRAP transporter small permease [Cohnella pontilimi]|uniref:TRAP transporter small permease n=1 Tax=Cohnella pontilimi TaxID=2564100 RepID=A0A4U0F9F2_9BACL|nr:TRAP transporter small permease [Cohnella pontilimi]TJY41317.1 TRAP transporter small permease [Cohnella pontilimi]